MTINEIQDEIIEEFTEIEDWMDRYQLLIDLGEACDALPAEEKNESNLIDGCQSRVWIVCDEHADGILQFRAESDALIVKGIVTLLLRVVNGHTAQEILDADHPRNRADRASFPHTLQWLARHDQAHQDVCPCRLRARIRQFPSPKRGPFALSASRPSHPNQRGGAPYAGAPPRCG